MRCPHCSAFLDRGANRCWRCWLPIADDEAKPSGPRLSRAERRRALEREHHRAWRRRIFLAGGIAVLSGAAAFFVYDTMIAPDPRPDADLAAAMLPTLGELPAGWSRAAEAPNLAPGRLTDCDDVLGAPFADAIEADSATSFGFDGGGARIVAESFLLDGQDHELTDEVVGAYGTGCAARLVARRVVGTASFEAASTERLELDADDATVRGRRVVVAADGDSWVVDVVAVGVDRGLAVLARASHEQSTGGVNTDELVALVVPRITDQVSS